MVKEKAYAKLNLYLDVLGKRSDGYHNIETIMAPINLYDVLTFKATNEPGIQLKSDVTITDKDEDNLVFQAAKHLLETFDIDKGVEITIEKNIPMAAGLAGGSADCAVTLRGINKLFKLNIADEQLATIGEQFGADVPYCIFNKACIGRGKGDELVFLNRSLKWPVLIVIPDLNISTREIYQSVNMDEVPRKKITTMSSAIYNRNYELMITELYNALEPFSFHKHPEVKALKDSLLNEPVDGVLMSGSGPAIAVYAKSRKALDTLADKYRDDHRVILTKIK